MQTMPQSVFTDRLRVTKPGGKLTYHVGSLVNDRCIGDNFVQVDAVAKKVWEAMEAGKVQLTQRVIMPGVSAYIATVRSKPHKTVQWEGCYHKDWKKL